MRHPATSRDAFDRLYQADPDPWNFASDAYEQGRYSATLKALAGRRYRHAFEPGCSIGVLTASLAGICDQVDAIDLSPTAAALAQERCAHLPNVRVSCGALAQSIPESGIDLIVFSEIGYYFLEAELQSIADRLVQCLSPNGIFLAVHWLGDSPDHPASGDAVHELLLRTSGLQHELAERHPGFRLDRWSRG